MRSLLLSLTSLSLLAASPVLAQTYSGAPVPAGPGKVVTGPPGLPSVEPLSRNASNINQSNTRSRIAPALPSTDLGPNASASDYLRAAQNALASGQTGRAQEALENAETRLLTRSTPMGMSGQPDQNPAVNNINSALQSLGAHDAQGAMRIVQQTIPMTDQMQTAATGPMGTGPMGSAPMPPGPMGTPGPTTTP